MKVNCRGNFYGVNPIKMRWHFRLLIIRTELYFFLVHHGKKIYNSLPLSSQTKYQIKSIIEFTLQVEDLLIISEDSFENYILPIQKNQNKDGKKRIAIDIQCLSRPTYFRGIGRYTMSLVKALALRNHESEFFLYSTNSGKIGNLELVIKEVQNWELPNIEVIIFDIMEGKKYVNRYEAVKNLTNHILDLNPTHVLIPSNFEHPQDTIYIDIKTFENVGVLIHDLIPLHYSEHLLPLKEQKKRYYSRLTYALQAKNIFTNSLFTKRDFENITGRKNGVENIGGAGFYPYTPDIRNNFKVRNGILCIAAETFHKNIPTLIYAYSQLEAEIRENEPLTVVGIKSESHVKKLGEIAGESQAEVEFLHFIDDESLESLYKRSKLVVVPSFIEGLSMPIFEAWSFATPVIASSQTVMAEIIQNDSMTFDPYSKEDLSRLIGSMLTDQESWEREQSRILERRTDFSWETVARTMDSWIASP